MRAEQRFPGIVVDTREQAPWHFGETPTTIGTLASGDYSVAGHETKIAIERKSLPDLVASVTRERDRFWRELGRLRDYDFAAVVVEADMGHALAGAYRSRAVPWSVITSTLAITADFGIAVVWGSDARNAARVAEWLLRRAWSHAVSGEVAA